MFKLLFSGPLLRNLCSPLSACTSLSSLFAFVWAALVLTRSKLSLAYLCIKFAHKNFTME